MRHLAYAIVAAFSVFCAAGCGNLSPRLNQDLNNSNGRIGEVENMQNSMKAEVGKLQSQAEIQNSKLDRIQQGLMNVQNNADNHGVQIFSGTGGLVLAAVACFGTIFVALHYRGQSLLHEKTANLLAERIVSHNDPRLQESVFEAALHTPVAKNVLQLIKKHQLRP